LELDSCIVSCKSIAMKKLFLFAFLLTATLAVTMSQSPVKVTVRLKNGKTIEACHFGKLKCETNQYASTYTILKGTFNGSHTEISDYKDISKLVLTGFTDAPVTSIGNQKGKITVIKKDGQSVTLENAELVLSCFNHGDRYNEIHVQIINPLTDQKVDLPVQMKDIESITF
jgi:hypothetical protein